MQSAGDLFCEEVSSKCSFRFQLTSKNNNYNHGLRTPREEIAFTARPKIHSHSQMFRYGQSIFCLPHRPNFSNIFDLCLNCVSVVRVTRQGVSRIAEASQNTVGNLTNFRKRIVIIIAMHFFALLKPHVSLTKEIIMITYTSSIKTSFKIRK